jgi:alpha-tubulin suppressor-like RCC1 family protein
MAAALCASSVAASGAPNRAVERGGPGQEGAVVFSFGAPGGGGKMRPLEHDVPTPLSGIPGQVVEVATSNSDGYALTADGTVWAWGAGALNELGDGTTPRLVRNPVEVQFPPGVDIVSLPNPMPYDSGLAIDSQHRLWGWGYNPAQALCLPEGEVPVPALVPATDVIMASGAGDHTLFVSGGKVYACGLGEDGELGDGGTADHQNPTAVTGLPQTGVVSLESSWQGSGALMSDGSYYDWGYNQEGQMGDGSTANATVPVHVALPGRARQVWQGGSNAGNGQTIALLSDGSVWTWGAGSWGQMGNGTRTGSPVPARVKFPSGARLAQVCSGGDTSYALDRSGRLWAWGGNLHGQVGDGASGPPQLAPVAVDVDLSQISATATNVAALGRGGPR